MSSIYPREFTLTNAVATANMVFGFRKRATASDALDEDTSLQLSSTHMAQPWSEYEMGKSELVHLVGRHSLSIFTISWGGRTLQSKAETSAIPRLTLLKMLAPDLRTLLALRRTSKAMERFVELELKTQLSKKFETLELTFPPQIKEGPGMPTDDEGLRWVGEYVKKLNVTVLPRRTEANIFQTIRDVETQEKHLHDLTQRQFFHWKRGTGGYRESFEAILRSLPYIEHLELILAPTQTTLIDRNGLQIEKSFFSPETWYWCPLFDERPAPENENGISAVTHLSPMLDIRLGMDAWSPSKLRELTVTNLTFSGLLGLSHGGLNEIGAMKDGLITCGHFELPPWNNWKPLRVINIDMVVFWRMKDMPSNYRVEFGSKMYKLGLGILTAWMGSKTGSTKLTWLKPTLAGKPSEMNVASPVSFGRAQGPSRIWWW
ncbi:hypothetical protein MMC11_001073 [Xylographa trunciseda]|nr:hypothetical protein [Xylographa trunciseda]